MTKLERIKIVRIEPAADEIFSYQKDEFNRVSLHIECTYLAKNNCYLVDVFNRLTDWELRERNENYDRLLIIYQKSLYEVPRSAKVIKSKRELSKFKVEIEDDEIQDLLRYYKIIK